MEYMKFETPDMVTENIDKIAALFPSAITEMRGEDGEMKRGVNFEVLKQLLSRDVVDGDECYEFTWVGKKAAMAEAARPITKTLRPVKADSRDWDTTENLYIEGDNLEVLKILQESYLGKVKMIYIDPPYNTGHDFVYPDSFIMDNNEYDAGTGYFNEDGSINYNRENSASGGRYHSDWCSMIYSRLILARNLLTDDGVIFISIDDNEQENLRRICDDVFGESNFIAQRVWKSKPQGGNDNKHIVTEHEYILIYARTIEFVTINGKTHSSEKYNKVDKHISERGKYSTAKLDLSTLEYRINLDYPITCPDGSLIYPGNVSEREWNYRRNGGNLPRDWQWRWSKERFERALSIELVEFRKKENKWNVYTKEYERMDYDGNIISRTIKYRTIIDGITTIVGTTEINTLLSNRIFAYPKPVELVKEFIAIGANSDDIILDFFSGSATTAHAVMQLNAEDGGHRKFIMVQLPEKCDEASEAYKAGYKNICEIGKERIRRAGDKIKSEHPDAKLDTGFRVFRVDESNMEDIYYHPEELTQTMLGGMVSNIKPDRTDLDLLYACLLDWGVEINLSHTQEVIDGCTVHNVDNGALCACFDERVPLSVIDYMAKQQPLRAVFRDNSFAADDSKINVTEIFKNLSPDTKVKVI